MTSIAATSPVDGQILGDFQVSRPERIVQQLAAASCAAKQWGETPIAARVQKLAPLSQLILTDLDNICTLIRQTSGKVMTETLLGEIYPVLDLLQYYQKHAARILASHGVATSPFAFPGATAFIDRRPYGVVAVISPWNYPFQLSVAPLLTALFAGNAVVLKVSELSLPIGELIAELFGKLDLPET